MNWLEPTTMIDGIDARTRIGAKVTGIKWTGDEGKVGILTRVNEYGIIFVRWPHCPEKPQFPQFLTWIDDPDD